jgi:hypothetical protein
MSDDNPTLSWDANYGTSWVKLHEYRSYGVSEGWEEEDWDLDPPQPLDLPTK